MGPPRLRARVPDAPYLRQLFVCTYGAWCQQEGSDAVRAALKAGVKAAGLSREVRVTRSGCLGQCGHGPNVVLWPDNVWYAGVSMEDVPALLEHLKGGPPVERLRYRPGKPGANKTPEVLEAEKREG